MDIQSYLARINYSGEIIPGFDVLAALQRSHLMAVPFENLDIHSHVPIDLANTFDKIVTRRRGGFCYELNGLFHELLKTTGFTVKMVSARVSAGEKGFGPEFDHMAIIANLDKTDYLVDVGFGDFALYPLKITLHKELQDPTGIFRIKPFNEEYKVVMKKNAAGAFIPEYLFSEKERQLADFYDMCRYHQTSSDSHFTQKRICSLPVKEGRITLTGNMLKITAKGTVTERELESEEEVRLVLADLFNIKIDR